MFYFLCSRGRGLKYATKNKYTPYCQRRILPTAATTKLSAMSYHHEAQTSNCSLKVLKPRRLNYPSETLTKILQFLLALICFAYLCLAARSHHHITSARSSHPSSRSHITSHHSQSNLETVPSSKCDTEIQSTSGDRQS